MNTADAVAIVYLVSVILFAVGLKRLARVRTSRSGNTLAAAGMLLAVVGALVEAGRVDYRWILAGLALGTFVGVRTVLVAKATAMPEIVARFNGFGGAASALVALALFWQQVLASGTDRTAAAVLGATAAVTLVASVLVGGATFSGSVVAEMKLRGSTRFNTVPARSTAMIVLAVGGLLAGVLAMWATPDPSTSIALMIVVAAASLLIGVVLVVPIGGADMPVVISLLNSASGLAAAAAGFALGHNLLIIVGTMVGAAGLILTQVMCRAMNRSLLDVLAGGFGAQPADDAAAYTKVLSSTAEEAAMVLEVAQSVIIVPGYGLAAARAQHSVHELAKALTERGCQVRYAIHPVAGRMPGHMNVVLAEADVPYEQLVEMDQINHEFRNTDVVLVVGANDVVNPTARQAAGSPISGMPILNVDQARRVFVIKRSLSPGYAGIRNELFELDNTVMLFGDAKEVLTELTAELQATAPARA